MPTWFLAYLLIGALIALGMYRKSDPKIMSKAPYPLHLLTILFISLIWPVPALATLYYVFYERKEHKYER